MRVFTTTDHDSHWPVGCASVVVAPDEQAARELIDKALKASFLDPAKGYSLQEIGANGPEARVLVDGEY